jgi:peptide-methionine (S)-S-oxide reductase
MEGDQVKIAQLGVVLAGLAAVLPAGQADTGIFAGGCFWCMEADFEKLPGVTDVVSGFTGGTAKDPTYYGDHTRHYESVEVTYDPEKLSYQGLLDYYWVHIDPFDPNGQFCDKGSSYKSAIFVADDRERKLAEKSRQKVQAMFPDQKVVTAILPASIFYPIKGKEGRYHQNYYKKNPVRYHLYRYTCGRDQRVHEIWGDRKTLE